jgi:hypothetical protein
MTEDRIVGRPPVRKAPGVSSGDFAMPRFAPGDIVLTADTRAR